MALERPPSDLAIPSLAPDEIHVWAVSPVADADTAEAVMACLSAHERHRAARMRHVDDRRGFVVGRARVRQVLSRYVSQHPAELDVVTRVDDRPVLAGAPSWFDFSFSRCEGLHVCAVAHGRRVGIDVEASTRDATARDVDLLSPDDLAWLGAQTADRRDAARAELLAKKEALAKAIGGVTVALSSIDVPRDVDGPGTVTPPPYRQGPWFVRSCRVASGVACAVAAEGEWRITLLRYPSDGR
jgi:4'-phosphopantetheinyl transferase